MKKSTCALVVSSLLSVTLLAGCATVDHGIEHSESLTQGQWNTPIPQGLNAQTSIDWWKAWNNDELLRLIALSETNNTDIRKALANVRAAAALADQATADLFPSLSLGAQASHSRRNDVSTDSYNAQGQGVWSFSLVGGNVAERRAARYEAQASLMNLQDARNVVAAEVAQNYVNLKLAYVKRGIAEQTLSNYTQACEIAQWRYEAGLVDQTDLDQSLTNRESARAAIPVADASIQRYRNALARLTGQRVADVQVSDVAQVPTAPMALSVSFPAQTLQQRPDVRSAELSLRAAGERVYVAQSRRFPSLKLTGNIGTQAATIGALGASGTGVAALVGALSMPLFNWADQVTSTEQAKANFEKAQAAYTAALIKALEETENALSGIHAAQARTRSLQVAREAAESAADLALQQYCAGLVDYQSVLNTQRSLFTAREAEQSNHADLATQLVVLYRAVGGAWQANAPETNQTDNQE